MNDANIPRFSELLDWLEGRLPPAQAQAVADRLEAADPATQADLDWLRLFLRARESIQFASPPPSVRENLRERFAAYTQAQQPPGFFQRWLAILTFDSRAQPATVGLRSAQSADEDHQRQLIYTADVAEIALSIQSSLPGRNFIVTGQIFPIVDTPAQAFSIQLLRDIQEVDLTVADELGEFTFENLPQGEYSMVVSGGGYEVLISSVHLQQ